jgi:hypothetical protein
MTTTYHALSLKQPWAALLVHGRKSIEVRKWSTPRRGLILIHAARVSDERAEAWKHVPEQLLPAARLTGGIIGCAQLQGCRTYATAEAFALDQDYHLNELDWFEPTRYGFVFTQPKELPFHPYPGWMRFFAVEGVTVS